MKANLVLILGIISATEGVFQRIYTTDTDKVRISNKSITKSSYLCLC